MGHISSNKLSEDYISAHLPFRGRSASQVLQSDSTLSSVNLWGKRRYLKCRMRIAHSCSDLANAFKNINRSKKVSHISENDTLYKGLKPTNKWQLWSKFFHSKDKIDVMSKKETKKNERNVRQRKNAAIFIPDYEEEQTTQALNTKSKRGSLEICDLEDSGTFDMHSN